MSHIWMPFYVGDYLKDTGHLTGAEHGAYMLLIMAYWTNGSLPDDDRKLARLARMTIEEWAHSRDTIAEFFYDGWKHRRIERELVDAQKRVDKAKDAAEKRWQSKRNTEASSKECSEHSSSIAQEGLGQCKSQSHSIHPTDGIEGGAPDKAKVSRKTKNRRHMAEDEQPEPEDCLEATTAGMSHEMLRAEWRLFRDYHLREGTLIMSMRAAWRTWVSKWVKFKAADAAKARDGPTPPRRNTAFDIMNGKDQGHERNNSTATIGIGTEAPLDFGFAQSGAKTVEGSADAGGRGKILNLDETGTDASGTRRFG